ncbi:hypothetical protein Cni_G07250 [Canna indica]|uniref:DUF659 domain-containing protein n=1 Tax=Canna indica TaxID=4628 RepID=A0AAQ3JYG1_9LILI|nr:hypothetical protein Cni_G07250 [Canna indica]
MMKKGRKEQVDYQCNLFFYTSALPFNVVKNLEFEKFCEMVERYEIGYKPPCYHDMREKLLRKAMANIDVTLEEFREEWKRTGCSIMSDGWTDRKRRSISLLDASAIGVHLKCNETNVDGVDGGEYNVNHDAILEYVENVIPDAIVEDVENVIPDVIVDEDEASCDDDDDDDGDDIEYVGGFEF